ncbi:hypothetical protein BDZ89DRAFT_1136235 [Hymenopellis radicata]|nr:hypothetical protein BDZ89DRAFT_1136235 [Hymenopellis radicata]
MASQSNALEVSPAVFMDKALPTPLVHDGIKDAVMVTHAGAMKKYSCATTIENNKTIISEEAKTYSQKLLNNLPKVRACMVEKVTLYNEASVATHCHTYLLVPVVKHLNAILKEDKDRTDSDVPDSEDYKNLYRQGLKDLNYEVQIYHQYYHLLNPGAIASRMDHLIVLGPAGADKKNMVWSTPKNFEADVRTAYKAHLSPKPTTKKAPQLALFIIEEKSAGTLNKQAWTPTYFEKANEGFDKEAITVDRLITQIRQYSFVVKCNMVVLFDYLSTILLRVDETGFRNKKQPRIWVASQANQPSKKPNFSLFALGVQRLLAVHAIRAADEPESETSGTSSDDSTKDPTYDEGSTKPAVPAVVDASQEEDVRGLLRPRA